MDQLMLPQNGFLIFSFSTINDLDNFSTFLMEFVWNDCYQFRVFRPQDQFNFFNKKNEGVVAVACSTPFDIQYSRVEIQ